MKYNPDKAIEIPKLEAGIMEEAVIIDIKEGTSKDFVNEKALDKWKGDINAPAIEVLAEGKFEGVLIKAKEIFNFKEGAEGETYYTSKSKMAKFQRFYKYLPKVGMKIKIMSNGEGFWNIYCGR